MEPGIDYTGISTCAICHDGQGRIFLNRRSRNCRDEWGKWDNCGGCVQFGESPEECLKRELAEEYGCKPIKWQFGGLVSAKRQLDSRLTHWLVLVYLVQIDPQVAKNNEPSKFDEVAWFTLAELPATCHSYFQQDFAQAKHLWEQFYHCQIDLPLLISSHSSTDRTVAS